MNSWDKFDDRKLPDNLCEKAQSFPESSMCANQVTLIFKDGKRKSNVILADGAWIVKVNGIKIENGDDLDFDPNDVEDILSEV
jgi:hypothetical protein